MKLDSHQVRMSDSYEAIQALVNRLLSDHRLWKDHVVQIRLIQHTSVVLLYLYNSFMHKVSW